MDAASFEPMLEKSSKINGEMADGKRRRQVIFASNHEKLLTICLGIALVIVACLTVGIIVLLLKPSMKSPQLCLTPECIKSASNILESMDKTVNPCDNFYNFTCGNWKKEHSKGDTPQINWFSERSSLVIKSTEEYLNLENLDDEPKSVHEARKMFRTCLNYDTNLSGTQSLMKLYKKLGVNIEALMKNQTSQSLMKMLGRAKKYLGLDALIGLEVIFDPANATITKIGLSMPEDLVFSGFRKKNVDAEYESIDPLEHYITKVFMYFNPKGDVNTAMELSSRLIGLLENLEEIQKEAELISSESVGETMTIPQLQNLVDAASINNKSKINFVEYLSATYETYTFAKSFKKENYSVHVFHKRYFQLLSKLMDNVTQADLEIYQFWRIHDTFGYHINYELSQMRSGYDFQYGSKISKRSAICAKTVTDLMKVALSYRITKMPKINETRQKVKQMVQNIKDVFEGIVRKVGWMDKETKERTIKKISAVQTVVSFFDDMTNKEWIDYLYQGFSASPDNHVDNILFLLKKQFEIRTNSLVKNDARNAAAIRHLLFDYLDVNAFYGLNDNTIYVPNGILQFPFFGLGLEALNYGSIGVILGHELTHGFDDSGRSFDEKGNIADWWSKEADAEYKNRTRCFTEKYSNFHVAEIQRTIDGNRTLEENIADNGGLIQALAAYKKYVEINGGERSLPGLEEYSSEQLFFLSYTNAWCSVDTHESLLDAMEDEHSPSFVRPILGLQNMKEFAEAWKCPVGSVMNPSHKCKLWDD